MEALLPYYERELAFLRRHSRDFAERYPKIAAQLMLSGEGCDDPHVERMIESFAFLTARISKKLEDGYPQFTEALLNVLYPHYLRPFPSCSIVSFDTTAADLQLSSPVVVPRGTELTSRPIKGAVCRFRTAWAVLLAPVTVAGLHFDATPRAPAEARLPAGTTATMSLVLKLPFNERVPDTLPDLRFYIDAEPSVAAALRDALFLKCMRVFAQAGDGPWARIDESVLQAVGFADEEALIDMPANSHSAYRHLTEYFAFPEKYNFIDLRLGQLPPAAIAAGELRLHFALKDLRPDSDASRLLQTVSAPNLRLGCVPVVNLFAQRGDPIRITHRNSSYPVLADARRAYAYEVYSIDAVKRVRQTAQGESITEFRPFFSLAHGADPARDGHYWFAQRNEMLATKSPGYETELTLVDADFDPVQPKTDVLSVQLTCTNRDLPTLMSVGQLSGDLFIEGGCVARSIRLLRKPTPPARFESRGDGRWRLISHLALNQLSLTGSGVAAFREILTLYDLQRNVASRRQIEGIVAVEQRAKTVWMAGKPFACFVRGVEVRLTVDKSAFVGSGLDVFARCIEHFLGLYAHLNSFIQLVLVSSRNGEEILRCQVRTGVSILG